MFRLKLLWWRLFHCPKYQVGQSVVNVFGPPWSTPLILSSYLGPWVSWRYANYLDDEYEGLFISEHWNTVQGIKVSMGYFWLPERLSC